MPDNTAKLLYNGSEIDLPVYHGTLGPNVVDISKVSKHGIFTYDPGYLSTASCESKITFVDGDKGILLYRGHPIEQLASKCDFLEVAHLLLYGDLPNHTKKKAFDQTIASHTMLNEQVYQFFYGFRQDAPPMAILVGVIGALSAFYHDVYDKDDPKSREMAALRLIAKMPTFAAISYKFTMGQPFIYPNNEMSYAENFLHMMFSLPSVDKRPDPILVKAMDRVFTLHADHEQNASTSTVRIAASTGADPFACIGAGISALWGPAHGGANEASLNMLKEIGDESQIGKYIAKAKDSNDPFRLMGFGHRVYKHYDPRAIIIRETCHEVLDALGAHNDPVLKLAMKLEKIALEDDYFIEKKLYPNVDFYSGIILSAIGIPSNMFTVIFALARTTGWVSQWLEMMSDPLFHLSRPRQLYTGPTQRDVKPISKR